MWELLIDELTRAAPGAGWSVVILRLLAAMVLGAVLGIEREAHEKSAGLRTHMLVALAAAVFTITSLELASTPGLPPEALRVDPLRIVQAVTTAVAFLSAGAIIVMDSRVKGMTTGAGMWMAGAVGTAAGAGYLGLAALASVLALVVLWLIRLIEPSKRRPGA